jgi:hypothetical protein
MGSVLLLRFANASSTRPTPAPRLLKDAEPDELLRGIRTAAQADRASRHPGPPPSSSLAFAREKLAAVAKGEGGPRLIDTYEAERLRSTS